MTLIAAVQAIRCLTLGVFGRAVSAGAHQGRLEEPGAEQVKHAVALGAARRQRDGASVHRSWTGRAGERETGERQEKYGNDRWQTRGKRDM